VAKPTVCLVCGLPTTNGSRCMPCNRGFRRAVHNPAYDRPEWRKRSKRDIGGARGALRLVVPRLRPPSASVPRPDERSRRSAGAGWRPARRDERLLQGVQQQAAMGADADPAGAALTCSDGRDGDDGLARPCSSPDGAALTKRNGVTALTGGDDVERAASTWGRTRSADLCGDQTAAARMSGRVLPETTRSAP